MIEFLLQLPIELFVRLFDALAQVGDFLLKLRRRCASTLGDVLGHRPRAWLAAKPRRRLSRSRSLFARRGSNLWSAL